ncbi:hypothetical protein PtB15_15B507 [Puccinia triticina]|nr:hypothetical protein PtB15_15B507 [Puccinia triticina]
MRLVHHHPRPAPMLRTHKPIGTLHHPVSNEENTAPSSVLAAKRLRHRKNHDYAPLKKVRKRLI